MIKVLYLVSGHTIMAKCPPTSGVDYLYAERPIRVELVATESGLAVSALPFGGVFGVEQVNRLEILKQHVISSREATKQEEDFWMSQTSEIQIVQN